MYPDPGMSPRLRQLLEKGMETGDFTEFHKLADKEAKAYKKAFMNDGMPNFWPSSIAFGLFVGAFVYLILTVLGQ